MWTFQIQDSGNRTAKMQVELDEETLKEIAKITHGQYFHAMNTSALEKIFDAIDKLEKVEIDSMKYTRYSEIFQYPLAAGFLLLLIELILSQNGIPEVSPDGTWRIRILFHFVASDVVDHTMSRRAAHVGISETEIGCGEIWPVQNDPAIDAR